MSPTVPFALTFFVNHFCQLPSSKRKIEKRTALQIGRWTGIDCARGALRRGAARHRAVASLSESAAGEERWSHLLTFFSLPTPSDLSATCVCPVVTLTRPLTQCVMRTASTWPIALAISYSFANINTLEDCSNFFRNFQNILMKDSD